jgi:hypothetical protein
VVAAEEAVTAVAAEVVAVVVTISLETIGIAEDSNAKTSLQILLQR